MFLFKRRKEKRSKSQSVRRKSSSHTKELIRLEAELEAFSDDPDQMIEQLRERFVAFLQEEADVSNQLTRIENDLENSRQQTQKQEEQLESLKEQLASAKSKASEQETALKSAKEKVQTLLAGLSDAC